ncbi:MAG: ABC transporter permease subunit [Actinomycetota bacterium]|nr:ABC transporter permease subunit [Actinomycetota bacterium]
MTVTTSLRPARVQPPPPSRGRLFRAALRSEWTKLASVRSTIWSLLVTLVIIIGLGALFCAARVSRWDHLDPGEQLRFDPAGFSLNGIFLAQLAIGVLGVLVMSSEYATGQIRATFGAIPQRRLVLAAKAVVFAVVVGIVSLVACVSAFAIGQAIFTAKHAGVSLGDPGVARAVLGGAMYLAVIGLMGLGLAAILRRTAGAIATLVGILLVLPILVNFLPSPWNDDISKYLPGQAGGAIFQVVQRDSNALSAWVGFAVLCAYAAVALVAGAVLVDRRDA